MKTQEEIRMHKRKQNIASIIILIVGIFFAYLIFGPKKQDTLQTVSEVQKTAASVKIMNITNKEAKIAKLEKIISLDAGGFSAEVISQFSGRVKAVKFEAGDRVYAGQILAVFDQSDLENSPKISFESAQKNYQLANDNLTETYGLVDENIDLAKRAVKIAKIKKEQADESGTDAEKNLAEQGLKIAKDQEKQAEIGAEIQLNGMKIQVEQARQAVEQSKIAYEKTFIKSPISGVIASKRVNKEDFLNAGSVVASVVGDGKLEAVIFLNQDEIKRIKPNDSVEIEINDEKYKGSIISYSNIANEANGRFEVKIGSVENLSKNTNQTGKVILNLYLNSSKKDSFFVPLDAVNIGQSKKEVFVIQNEKARAKEVEIGKIIGTQIEVLSGLEEGDVLIVENSRNLQDGQFVKVSNL